MFWTIVDRIVNLVFLLLAVVIIVTLINFSEIRNQTTSFSLQLERIKESFQKVSMNNLTYLENRVNRLGEIQDQYQTSTTARMAVLESRLSALEKENKSLKTQNRIVNTNNNTNIVNGK